MAEVRLTGRQRDFLASYPDDVVVELQADTKSYTDDVCVRVAEGEIAMGAEELWLPPQGFIDQPTVTLGDWEGDLDRIPSALWTPEQIEARRHEVLDELPPAVGAAVEHLIRLGDIEGLDVDWDEVLDVLATSLRENSTAGQEDEVEE